MGNFHQRAGAALRQREPGGKDSGYHLKLAFGSPEVREEGQWQVATSYRHVGSDAVLDAFTDGDLGLGGTNLKGFTMGPLMACIAIPHWVRVICRRKPSKRH